MTKCIENIFLFFTDLREKTKKEKSKSREPEAKLMETKNKDEGKKDEIENEKPPLETDTNDTKMETGENLDPKSEPKDDLLSADHQPEIPKEEKALIDKDKENSDVKTEKERDRSPRRSRSKSYDRSRYLYYIILDCDIFLNYINYFRFI